MKKLYVLAAALMISTASFAGVTEVYNAINENPGSSATKVDQKAAELKSKIDGKLTKLKTKAAEKAVENSVSSLTSQQTLKSQLEEKLAGLVASGEGASTKANDIRAEIESLQKLIEAAQQ